MTQLQMETTLAVLGDDLRYPIEKMFRRFNLKTLLAIPVLFAAAFLAAPYFFSPRKRVIEAGGELHTNETFGFDLNGNAWYGVLYTPPAETSAINAAVFPRDARFDAAIAQAVNKIDTLEYLGLEGNSLDLAAVRELSNNTRLREINLLSTNVGDAEMLALASIPTLECLTIFKTNVTATGVKRFSNLRPDVNLVNWYR
ncbi:MAG: hypothetical protein AAGG48_30025 [Planctomycetota bacterium]